jgi:hypothetical protein
MIKYSYSKERFLQQLLSIKDGGFGKWLHAVDFFTGINTVVHIIVKGYI